MQLEMGTDNDDGTPRIVHPFSQKILAEPTLFAPEKIRKALERPVSRSKHRLAHPAIVDEGIHGFLKHALFVAHDDFRSVKFLKLFKAVVPVDYPAIEIVEVRRGETPSVELHHGTEIRRNHRKHLQHHPAGIAPALAKILRHVEALYELPLLLPRSVGNFFPQSQGKLVHIEFPEEFLNSFGTDAGAEFLVVGNTEAVLPLHDNAAILERGIPLTDHDIAGIFQGDGLHLGHETPRILFVVKLVFAYGNEVSLAEGMCVAWVTLKAS